MVTNTNQVTLYLCYLCNVVSTYCDVFVNVKVWNKRRWPHNTFACFKKYV